MERQMLGYLGYYLYPDTLQDSLQVVLNHWEDFKQE